MIVDLSVPMQHRPNVQGDFIAMRYWSACMQLHVVAMLASGLLGATEGNTFAATDAYEGILGAVAGGLERAGSSTSAILTLLKKMPDAVIGHHIEELCQSFARHQASCSETHCPSRQRAQRNQLFLQGDPFLPGADASCKSSLLGTRGLPT